MNQTNQEQEALAQQIAQLEMLAKTVLSKEAQSRLSAVKVAHQEKYIQTLIVLANMIKQGHKRTLTDEEFKQILQAMEQPKRETKIRVM